MADRHYFVVNPSAVRADGFRLAADETHHLRHVLRARPGAELWLTDGAGTVYAAVLQDYDGEQAFGTISARYPEAGEPPRPLHLVAALLKRESFELLCEKAVELGVTTLTPLVTERCLRREVNPARLEKIIVAAMKQCGRSRRPQLAAPVSLPDWLAQGSAGALAVCHSTGTASVAEWFATVPAGRPLTVVVGPEGDFTPEELAGLQAAGAATVTLGPRRLRAETAALAALAILNDCSLRIGNRDE